MYRNSTATIFEVESKDKYLTLIRCRCDIRIGGILMLMKELAEKIVKEVRKLLDEDFIVVNTEGTIIASTDDKRVGTFHEGALIASEKKDKLIISEEDQHILKGVKAGINLPIFFQGEVIGVIGITGLPQKVSPYGEMMRKMTELLISESYYTEQIDWQSRTLEALLFDWIKTKDWSTSFLDRAKLLDINLDVNRRVVITEFEDSLIIHRDQWLAISSWNEKGPNDIMIRWGSNRIVLLLSETSTNGTPLVVRKKIKNFKHFLSGVLKVPLSIGVGMINTPYNVQDSYNQAERALKVSKKSQMIVFDEDLTLEMILEEIPPLTQKDFLDRTIGIILKDQELIATLKVFFEENLSIKNTAEALHIHINTLHYRLKKIVDLTGLNPRKTEDLFVFYLSIKFLDIHTK